MSIGLVRTARILHRAFGDYPAGHRLHTFIRFLTAPFHRTLDDVPRGVCVLEIGSGHGAFSVLMVEERGNEVIAVDPDIRKGLLPSPSARLRKVVGYDDCIRGTFDAVVLYDVTYHMPLDLQRDLLTRAFARLRPGGVLLWKDMDPAVRLKMKWARFQEWLSDTFLGITLGSGFVHSTRAESEAMLRKIGFTDVRARAVDRGYLHPHLLYTAIRPE
jgi:cyclopropane fatty-acyl-phospholipid synthase-like methyltransferase